MNRDNLSAVKRLLIDVGNDITLIPMADDADITPGERRTLIALTGDLLRAESRLARLVDNAEARAARGEDGTDGH